jgi:hypothetical protein
MGSGAHATSYPMKNVALFFEEKRPDREANHSPPNIAEVKKAWVITSTHPLALMKLCSVGLTQRQFYLLHFNFLLTQITGSDYVGNVADLEPHSPMGLQGLILAYVYLFKLYALLYIPRCNAQACV